MWGTWKEEKEELRPSGAPRHGTSSATDGQAETDRQEVSPVIRGDAALLRVKIVQMCFIQFAPNTRPIQEWLD